MSALLVRFAVIGVALLGFAGALSAQDDARGAQRPGDERRVALVIGNGDYEFAGFLPNPTNDAQAFGDALRDLGFEVFLGLDLDKENLDNLLRQYTRALDGADVGLFFYAGHGLQVDGVNYIVPVDAVLERASDLDFETVDSQIVLRQFDRPDFTGLVFLDACRDNPLARSMRTGTRSIGRGLAEVSSATGTLIAYATQPGNVAYDGDGEHSPFTQALLNHISSPDLEIRLMLDFVGEEVAELTDGQQQPWVHFSRLRGGFYFNPQPEDVAVGPDGPEIGPDVAINENDPAVRFYEYATELESPTERLLMLEQFIRLYPTHPLAVLAATDVQALRETRAAINDPTRENPDSGQPNATPTVEAGRSLTIDADAGPTALQIAAPSDTDGDELTVRIVELPSSGVVQSLGVPVSLEDTLKPGEVAGLEFVPDPEAVGAVGALRYRVEDGNGGSADGVVRISLRAPNRPPEVREVLAVTIEQGAEPVPLGIPAPIDPDNDRLQIAVTWLPRAGTIELNGRTVTRDEELTAYQLIALTYRPDPERIGDQGSFEYQVDDGRGGSIRATVRISVARPNTQPVLAEEMLLELASDPDGVAMDLVAPTDADGDPLTVRVTWTPRWGSVMNGTARVERGDTLSVTDFTGLRYIGAAGHDGDAGSFEFAVSDGRGDPVRGMVRISVTAPNAPPDVVAEQAVTVIAEDGLAGLNFTRPSDPNGDPLEYTVDEIPFRGRLVVNGRTLRAGAVLDGAAIDGLAYEPAIGHSGSAGQLAMTVTDGASAPQTAVIRISVDVTNAPPIVASDRTITIRPGVLVPLGIEEPRDPDGDPITVRVLEVPNGGFARLNATVLRPGQVLQPADLTQIGFELTGSDLRTTVFSYEADDGRGGVAVGSVALEVEEIAVVTAPPGQDLAGDTIDAAYDLGQVDGRSVLAEDRIDPQDVEDFYRLRVADWSMLDVSLEGLTGDLDLFIYTDDDRNVASSELIGEVDEVLAETIPAGTYYIRIMGFEGAESDYSLVVNASAGTPPPPDQVGNTPETADLLRMPGGAPIVVGDRVDLSDGEDWYGFDISDFTELTLSLTGMRGDLDLDLVDDFGAVVVSSQEGGITDEFLTASIGPGRYYARVYVYSGQSDYELAIEGAAGAPPPPDIAGNFLDDATPLGSVRGSVSFGDWVGTADTNDYLSFDLDTPATVTIGLSGLSGDADLELLDANGELVGSSNNIEFESEEIVADLGAGRHIIRVYPFDGQTDYRLDIAATSAGVSGPPDRVESIAELRAWEGGWSRDERRQVQRALQLIGLYNAGIDGLFGNGTRGAISAYQQRRSEATTGYLTREQRLALSIDAGDEAMRRAETAADQARAAAAAPNADVEYYDSGDSYSGDRDRQGHGVYEWDSGHRYEGQWDGARDGYGVLILADGSRYAGQWRDSIFVGFGVSVGSDGTRRAGEWNVAPNTQFVDGMNGYGQITFAGGAVERGLFRSGVLVPQ